jgi:hypothetical protein
VGAASHRVTYERLVSEPEATVRELMVFIDESYEPAMLDYAKVRHDFPEWEWGSADVQAKPGISTAAVGRACRELPAEWLELLAPIARPESTVTPAVHGHSESRSTVDGELVSAINAFSSAMGLDVIAPAQTSAAAWLWRNGLAGYAWRGKHLFSTGPIWHPLLWATALLGARVTVTGQDPPRSHIVLGQNLGVQVEWVRTVPQDLRADAVLAFTPCTPDLLRPLPRGGPAFIAGEGVSSWIDALSGPRTEKPEAAVLVRSS